MLPLYFFLIYHQFRNILNHQTIKIIFLNKTSYLFVIALQLVCLWLWLFVIYYQKLMKNMSFKIRIKTLINNKIILMDFLLFFYYFYVDFYLCFFLIKSHSSFMIINIIINSLKIKISNKKNNRMKKYN